ncbi:hypothetical protein PUN28_000310 [Cardiocondyla obscurior]|uniref:Uncharacterized protein n=1 Tax=Cardiocondyla obscurior TaxID=286306 RepID=A0AAW2GZB0_9HYME
MNLKLGLLLTSPFVRIKPRSNIIRIYRQTQLVGNESKWLVRSTRENDRSKSQSMIFHNAVTFARPMETPREQRASGTHHSRTAAHFLIFTGRQPRSIVAEVKILCEELERHGPTLQEDRLREEGLGEAL